MMYLTSGPDLFAKLHHKNNSLHDAVMYVSLLKLLFVCASEIDKQIY